MKWDEPLAKIRATADEMDNEASELDAEFVYEYLLAREAMARSNVNCFNHSSAKHKDFNRQIAGLKAWHTRQRREAEYKSPPMKPIWPDIRDFLLGCCIIGLTGWAFATWVYPWYETLF